MNILKNYIYIYTNNLFFSMNNNNIPMKIYYKQDTRQESPVKKKQSSHFHLSDKSRQRINDNI